MGAPMSKDAKLALGAILGTVAVFALLGYWLIYLPGKRDEEVNKLLVCAEFRGADAAITAEFLRHKIDDLMDTGSSWNEAYGAVAAIVGCPGR